MVTLYSIFFEQKYHWIIEKKSHESNLRNVCLCLCLSIIQVQRLMYPVFMFKVSFFKTTNGEGLITGMLSKFAVFNGIECLQY